MGGEKVRRKVGKKNDEKIGKMRERRKGIGG